MTAKAPAVQAAAEANQKALQTASKLQLDVLKEQNLSISEVVKKLSDLYDLGMANQEILENHIAGMSGIIEQLNNISETFIKLHQEMKQMYDAIQEHVEA